MHNVRPQSLIFDKNKKELWLRCVYLTKFDIQSENLFSVMLREECGCFRRRNGHVALNLSNFLSGRFSLYKMFQSECVKLLLSRSFNLPFNLCLSSSHALVKHL